MDSVQVAVRIRPLVSSEINKGCRPCIEKVRGEPQVVLGRGRHNFTFNHVFDESHGQNLIYSTCIESLISQLFDGYNVTVLAYGQTGSGKTFTMGTDYSGTEEMGIIPRAIIQLFHGIQAKTNEADIQVDVSFLELYNESLYDLLTSKSREQSVVDLRESPQGICIPGLTLVKVQSAEETLAHLKEGSLGRVTGSTAMNAQSSRSHAIFTVHVRINPKDCLDTNKTAKFHLVDLAGSERSKKTGTSGDRFKEGININKGLLPLGNVISQLGEGSGSYINYRDSKLTRLLQDSLGGNSITLMIACVSPADFNQDETLSTLRYADRARKIKNKPVVNQDPQAAENARLRQENEELRLKIVNLQGNNVTDTSQLELDLTRFKRRICELTSSLQDALTQNAHYSERTELYAKKVKEELMKIKPILLSSPIQPDLTEQLKAIDKLLDDVDSELSLYDQEQVLDSANMDTENIPPGTPASPSCDLRRRMAISKELKNLSVALSMKEDLAKRLSEQSNQPNELEDFNYIKTLEDELFRLQAHKKALERQLALAERTTEKICEEKQASLLMLESKLILLRQKLDDKNAIKKLKDASNQKLLELKNEILQMKQTKVKLIQQLKKDNDRFKAVSLEMKRLQNVGVKWQIKFARLEEKELLLKRKLAAANKRLNASMNRNTTTKRQTSCKMSQYVQEDIETIESAYMAEKSLESLIQDRSTLTEVLTLVKATLEESASLSEEGRIELLSKKLALQEDINLRSAQISDLNEKIITTKDNQKLHGWDHLQSMSEVKNALKYVFDILCEDKRSSYNMQDKLQELEEKTLKLTTELDETKTMLEQEQRNGKSALITAQNDFQDQINLVLRVAEGKLVSDCEKEKFTDTLSNFREQMYAQVVEERDTLKAKLALYEEKTATKKATTFQDHYLLFSTNKGQASTSGCENMGNDEDVQEPPAKRLREVSPLGARTSQELKEKEYFPQA